MNFNTDIFDIYMTVILSGTLIGFFIGFISWIIGFAIYEMIHFFKLA